MVKIGQRLIIPGKSMMADSGKVVQAAAAKPAPAAASSAPKASGEAVKHTVKPGETLGAIARKYQVRVGDIATANNIADPAKIRPGMVLTIPGWQAPSGKSSNQPKSETAAPVSSPDTSAPTLTPAPDQNPDASAKPNASEPPVIQVDNGTPEPGKL